MTRRLTKNDVPKTIRITPELHKALRQASLDRDEQLLDVADEVIVAGMDALGINRPRRVESASAN